MRLPPLPGAKIQLLEWLEKSGSCEAIFLADELLEARTLRELAERVHGIAMRLQEVDGHRIADPFWAGAKEILLRWRDGAATNG